MWWISTWSADEQKVWFGFFQGVLQVTKFVLIVAKPVFWTAWSALVKIHACNSHVVMILMVMNKDDDAYNLVIVVKMMFLLHSV